MSRELRSHPPPRASKRRRTIPPTDHSSAVRQSSARLLRLPPALFQLVYLHLPWYERLLHVTHVARQLLPGPLLWAKHDHVRLGVALMEAVDMRKMSALHCIQHVQSLCVEREMEDELMIVAEYDFDSDDDEPHVALLPRLPQCLLELQLETTPHSATLPFSQLRCLVASTAVFQCLLDYAGGLPHLHSLSLCSLADEHEGGHEAEFHMLSTYLSSRPALRRLRVVKLGVAHKQLLALPCIEYVDVRLAYTTTEEEPLEAPTSAALRHLLLQDTDVLRNAISANVVASLTSAPLQSLSLTARLTDDSLQQLMTLRSLTALDLHGCHFERTNALDCLLTEETEPLLPHLQQLTLEDCEAWGWGAFGDAEDGEEEKEDARTYITAAVLSAYSRQLRHVKWISVHETIDSLQAVMSVLQSGMPQLQSLTMGVHIDNFEPDEEDGDDDVLQPVQVEAQPHRPLALPALCSLTLRLLPMADAALDQLLACCPQLLELSVHRSSPLTAAVWQSLLRCRQLLSLGFYAVSVVGPTKAVTPATAWSSSPASPSSTAAFAYLRHLSLGFAEGRHITAQGFTHILDLLRHSPITSVALRLPSDVNPRRYVPSLVILSHLTALTLAVDEQFQEELDWERKEDSVVDLLREHSEARRWSNEQHTTNMRDYWQDGLLSDDEAGLRAKYAAGVKMPVNWEMDSDGWSSFSCADSDRHSHGRKDFFRSLESKPKRR